MIYPTDQELVEFSAAVRGKGPREDALAKLWGLERMPGESDLELQYRIQQKEKEHDA